MKTRMGNKILRFVGNLGEQNEQRFSSEIQKV